MIKTALKHKLAEICIDQLFKGLFKNFPSMFGEIITLNELRINADKYIGKYIIAVYPNRELLKSVILHWRDEEKLNEAIAILNEMTPIYIKDKTNNGSEIKFDFAFNQEGKFMFNDPNEMENVNDLILFNVSD